MFSSVAGRWINWKERMKKMIQWDNAVDFFLLVDWLSPCSRCPRITLMIDGDLVHELNDLDASQSAVRYYARYRVLLDIWCKRDYCEIIASSPFDFYSFLCPGWYSASFCPRVHQMWAIYNISLLKSFHCIYNENKWNGESSCSIIL